MTEIEALLERQARWQKARKDLPWPEKIRMAEAIRSSVENWRARVPGGSTACSRHAPSGASDDNTRR